MILCNSSDWRQQPFIWAFTDVLWVTFELLQANATTFKIKLNNFNCACADQRFSVFHAISYLLPNSRPPCFFNGWHKPCPGKRIWTLFLNPSLIINSGHPMNKFILFWKSSVIGIPVVHKTGIAWLQVTQTNKSFYTFKNASVTRGSQLHMQKFPQKVLCALGGIGNMCF